MKQKFNSEIFSKSIRQKRLIDLNIDMREAAKQIGISAATLSRYENGNLPELLPFARICKWLNSPMDKFISISKK